MTTFEDKQQALGESLFQAVWDVVHKAPRFSFIPRILKGESENPNEMTVFLLVGKVVGMFLEAWFEDEGEWEIKIPHVMHYLEFYVQVALNVLKSHYSADSYGVLKKLASRNSKNVKKARLNSSVCSCTHSMDMIMKKIMDDSDASWTFGVSNEMMEAFVDHVYCEGGFSHHTKEAWDI